jgi:hypothetical protein
VYTERRQVAEALVKRLERERLRDDLNYTGHFHVGGRCVQWETIKQSEEPSIT